MQKTVYSMHMKLLRAFQKVKRDVFDLRVAVNMQQDTIKKMVENEKALLSRIRVLERRMALKSVKQPVVQPKVITKYKTRTKTKVKVVEKVIRAKKTYVGAKTSMKLHSENCPFAKNIKRANKVLFKSKVKPFGLGYDACDCLKK